MNGEARTVAPVFLPRPISLAAPGGNSRGSPYDPEMADRLHEIYPPETVDS